MVTVVHVLGDSDFGLNTTGRKDAQQLRAAALQELREGGTGRRQLLNRPALSAYGFQSDRTPLAVALDKVAAESAAAVRLLLVHTPEFADLAGVLASALRDDPALYGTTVEEATLVPANFEGVSEAVARALAGAAAGDVVQTSGSGSSNLALASLVGVFRARPVRLFVVDSVQPGGLESMQSEDALDRWLLRRRLWRGLRVLEPDHAAPEVPSDPVERLDQDFWDEVARRSLKATLMARAWLTSQYLARGGAELNTNETLGQRIQQIRGRYPNGDADRWLCDMAFLNEATTPRRNGAAHPAKPLSLLTSLKLRREERPRQARLEERARQSGQAPPAPVFPASVTPHLLVVRAVGTQELAANGTLPFTAGQHEARSALLHAWFPSETGLAVEDWCWHAGLVITEQTRELGEAAATQLQALGWASVTLVTTSPAAVGLRADLWDACDRDAHLAEGWDCVQRVTFLVGPGTHQMNRQGLLGAYDVAQMAGVPMTVGSIREDPPRSGRSTVTVAAEVPPLLGWDEQLCAVAVHHVQSLDLGMAGEVLRSGSAALNELAREAGSLHDAVLGRSLPAAQVLEAVRHADAAERIDVINRRLTDWDPDTAVGLARVILEKNGIGHPGRTARGKLWAARNQSYLSHGRNRMTSVDAGRLLGAVVDELAGITGTPPRLEARLDSLTAALRDYPRSSSAQP